MHVIRIWGVDMKIIGSSQSKYLHNEAHAVQNATFVILIFKKNNLVCFRFCIKNCNEYFCRLERISWSISRRLTQCDMRELLTNYRMTRIIYMYFIIYSKLIELLIIL